MKKHRKNTPYNATQSTIKVLVSIMFIFFLVSFVGAELTFDNSLKYSNKDLKVEIKNTFGLGKTFGTVELKSHPSVDHIKIVNAGEQIVMWYEINYKKLYKKGFGEVEFIDVNTGGIENRDYEYVFWKEGNCKEIDFKNGTISNQCSKGEWLPYNSSDILEGKSIIGIKVDVQPKDKIDVIWTMSGKKISKHAEYKEGGNESVQVTSGAAGDVSDITTNLFSNTTYGYLKAIGFNTGAGSSPSNFIAYVNLSNGTNIASKEVTGATHPGGAGTHYYFNFSFSGDYNEIPLEEGAFTAEIHRNSGDVEFSQGEHNNYSGTYFSFYNQTTPLSSQGVTFTFTERTTLIPPTVVLYQPYNNSNHTTESIDFRCKAFDDFNVTNITLTVDGVVRGTTSFPNNDSIYGFPRTVEDGDHNWTCEAFDNDSQQTIHGIRLFSVDTSIPTLNITNPMNTSSTEDYITENNKTIYLNVSFSDSNLDVCIVGDGTTNHTINCNTQNITFYKEYGTNTFYVWVNDTFGNSNFSSITSTFNYKVLENSKTYNEETTEGSAESYVLNLSLGSGQILNSANLSYDSIGKSVGISSGDFQILTSSFAIPTVEANENISFFWNLSLNSGYLNTSTSNQTVINFGIDDCGSYTERLYNFTIVDETTQTQLNLSESNTTGNINLQIYSVDRTLEIQNYSNSFEGTNPFGICLNSNLSSGKIYIMDAQVQYEAVNFEKEFYHIQNETLDNSVFNQNITLYDINSSLSQEFKMTFKDSSFLAVEDALIHIKRKYIDEGLFKIVEIPKTDSNGETIAHLIEKDVIYTFQIYKNNEILATFNNVLAICENVALGDCEINLNSFASHVPAEDFTILDDFTFAASYNKTTRTITSDFTIPSGTTSDVVLNATLYDNIGNTHACTDSLISTSGTLNCVVPQNLGNATVIVKLWKNDEEQFQGFFKMDQDSSDLFGGNQVILILFLYLTIFGFALSDNPLITGIMFILGAILAILINFVNASGIIGASATVLWLVVAIVIVLVKGGRRN